MRCPSAKSLVASFPKELNTKKANLLRALAKSVDDGEKLKMLIDDHCPGTASYVRSMHSNPYRSQMWRTTVTLHAIDDLIGGYGMETLGPKADYEYSNMGDPYTTTLIYKKATDALSIGCWGDISEKHPNW